MSGSFLCLDGLFSAGGSIGTHRHCRISTDDQFYAVEPTEIALVLGGRWGRGNVYRDHWVARGPRHLGIGNSLCIQRICHIRAVVVMDSEGMPRGRTRIWHRHAYAGPSGSDVLGDGRRVKQTSGRQRMAAGNRHHPVGGIDDCSV